VKIGVGITVIGVLAVILLFCIEDAQQTELTRLLNRLEVNL
jgi:hypothetical protein